MVNWWPGDGNVLDIMGSNHGTLTGDATFTPSKVWDAFSFDGTGDGIQVPSMFMLLTCIFGCTLV